MLAVTWQQFAHEKSHFRDRYSLNDESVVMGEEKEATTPTSALTRLENHFLVKTWM